MFSLFSRKPLLDEDATRWLFEAYAWALKNFGSDLFYEDTILVTASDRHFPDKADNVEEMIATVFGRVKTYAQMQNWPYQLEMFNPGIVPATTPEVFIQNAVRGPDCRIILTNDAPAITLFYDPNLVKKPEMLIAALSHELAACLSRATQEAPPGGEELKGHIADFLSIFMGFGLFLANNAFSVCRGSCGGCGMSVQTSGYLTEDEMTYALAIFCALKNIQNPDIFPHLKKTLHPFFKKALKEIKNNATELNRLKSLNYPLKSINASFSKAPALLEQ